MHEKRIRQALAVRHVKEFVARRPERSDGSQRSKPEFLLV